MGYYSRFLFPHLCDHLMGQSFLAEERKTLLADVGGDILGIGFGTGLNLAHYPTESARSQLSIPILA